MIQQSKKYKIAIIAYNLDSGGLAKVIKNVFLLFKEISFFNVELVLLDDIKRFNLDEKVVYFGDLANIKSPFYNKINKYIIFIINCRFYFFN